MLKQINKEHLQFNSIASAVVEYLKSVIKKVLTTNKVIPTYLANVIAKVVVFSSIVDEAIEKKHRYKKYTHLKKVFDHIAAKTAHELSPASHEDQDSVTVDFVTIAREVVSSLTGKYEIVDEVRSTFEQMLKRLSGVATERTNVQIMKLTSLIVQSNNDSQKRKHIINEYL